MALELSHDAVLICEGMADQNFFRKLIEARGLPSYDVVEAKGITNFGQVLRGIAGDRHNFRKVKGVLLAADSGKDAIATFNTIIQQLRAVGGYPIPTRLSEIAPRIPGWPAVAITCLPDDHNPGSLETVCNREIVAKQPWVENCVDQFLRCDKISAWQWSAEKRDKARYHCMVAALNEDDPSKALSYAFKNPNPLIDLTAKCFDEVGDRLKSYHFDFLR